MNLLHNDENQRIYGSVRRQSTDEAIRQQQYKRCTKKTSLFMCLLAFCILGVGLFVTFQVIAKYHVGKMNDGDGIDENGLSEGGILGNLLMSDDEIDYRTISNAEWRDLWIAMGYNMETVNGIDFHTYSILGVNYKQIFRDLIGHNYIVPNILDNSEDKMSKQGKEVPLFEDCSCDYCLGFCEHVYCPICMNH